MNALLDMVFQRRGYTIDYLKSIHSFQKDVLLKDIDAMSEALFDVYEQQEKIVVYPDFDMDGIMSGVIGYAGLSELGFNVALFVPDPQKGYGITKESMDDLLEQYPYAKAIITCDVGTSEKEGLSYAKEKGLRVFITDHHQETKKTSVRGVADFFVNPMRLDETYPYPQICGAYVLWKVLFRYTKKHYSSDRSLLEQMNRLRVFAGIGTVSDLMPVLYENRALIKDAISICQLVYSQGSDLFLQELTGSIPYQNAFRGLHEVLMELDTQGKLRTPDDIDEGFFGFYLAPMFNAIKRMGEDMDHGFGVFFNGSPKQRSHYLYTLNEKRKKIVDDHFRLMTDTFQSMDPYIYLSHASAGLLGLLATKMTKLTQLPCLALREHYGSFSGSGRSPSWYPARTRLQNEGFYVQGHEHAFGVGVTDAKELMSMYAFLKEDVPSYMQNLDAEELQDPYDYEIIFPNPYEIEYSIPLFLNFALEVEKLKPFGNGFTEPFGVVRFSPKDAIWSEIGGEKQHLKVILPYGLEILLWNDAKNLSSYLKKDLLTVTGHMRVNNFMGNQSVNFIGDVQYD